MRKLCVYSSAISVTQKAYWSSRALIYHPDRVPAESQAAAEHVFRTAKAATEILSDPVKRFAYDRLGPGIFEPTALAYRHCKSIGDFVRVAILRDIGSFYLMFAGVTTIMTFLNFMPYGRYVCDSPRFLCLQLLTESQWRWVILAGMAVFEGIVITRPAFPPILTYFINPIFMKLTTHPPLLPFELVHIIRSLWSSVFIALNQLAPLYVNAAQNDKSDVVIQQQLGGQQQVLKVLFDRTKLLLGLELVSFQSNPPDMIRARDQTKAWMIRNRIQQDPMVQSAVDRAIRRRHPPEDSVAED